MKFVFDLDGTLCFDRMTIAPDIKCVLEKAQDFGHEVIFASARAYRDCISLLTGELAYKRVVGLNGGLVYENGQLTFKQHLTQEAYQNALTWCHYFRLPYFVDDDFDYAYFKGEKIPFISSVDPLHLANCLEIDQLKSPIKMVIYLGDHEELAEPFCRELKALNQVDVDYHEHEKCLYLNPYATNKATTVMRQIGSDFIAFGNDKNDIDLFKASLYSVQVGNFPSLNQYADEQVEGNSAAVCRCITKLFELY
ncbi:HAD hydrolase family protein [Streptococcus sp. H31]|uniref:HAD hydrolase family protein n=1 Tax=Streptococcus huangxiaojuni TaxID=3237239 RepID=UPI0034A5529B